MKIGTTLVAFASILSVGACSTGKQNNTKEGVDTLAMSDVITSPVDTAIPIFGGVDANVKTQLNLLVTDYFVINQMLIADNHNRAKEAARKLSDNVNKFDMAGLTAEQMDFYLTQVSKLKQGLAGIQESADIEKSRTALATLSEGMYALVKAFHPNTSALYYQHCPMARNGQGANWLSGTKEIVNPYMGQMMPECGRTEEILH